MAYTKYRDFVVRRVFASSIGHVVVYGGAEPSEDRPAEEAVLLQGMDLDFGLRWQHFNLTLHSLRVVIKVKGWYSHY